MEFKPWMKNITADDMPNDDLKYIAENAGIKSALILIFLLPGLTVNIPKYALRKIKEKYIMKEYDGSKFTLNRLAIECELSQRYVYNLIKKRLRARIKESEKTNSSINNS